MRHAGAWLGLLVLAAILLRGRYSVAPDIRPLMRESYLSSLFYLVLTLPTAHYLLRLSPLRKPVVYGATAFLFVVLTLPYRWLKLTRWHYVFTPHPWNEAGLPDPKLTFLPKTFPPESFPHERVFFFCLFGSVAVVAIALTAYGTRRKLSLRAAARRIAPWLFGYAVILVETWLHTGFRSGYALNAFYVVEASRKSWYIAYLFPHQLGAVSNDFHFFFSLDKYFQGMPEAVETMLLRRSYFHYLGSQFDYFANPFVVYLVLNTLLWGAAALAMHSFLLRVTGRLACANFGAALVCVGNGFSYFVSQPMSYLAGYALAIFAVETLDALHSPAPAGPPRPVARALLCGVVLGLFGSVYDAQPIIFGLVPLALARRRSLVRTALSLATAVAIPAAFGRLQFHVLKLPRDEANEFIAEDTTRNVLDLISHFKGTKSYYLLVHVFPIFAQNLAYAFMIAAVALFLLGFSWARWPRDRGIVACLLFPAFLLNVALVLGQVTWSLWQVSDFPRLSYIAYPAIYAGGALALERVAGSHRGRRRWVASWALVVMLGVWQNLDAFGFLSPIVHFYFPEKKLWVDEL